MRGSSDGPRLHLRRARRARRLSDLDERSQSFERARPDASHAYELVDVREWTRLDDAPRHRRTDAGKELQLRCRGAVEIEPFSVAQRTSVWTVDHDTRLAERDGRSLGPPSAREPDEAHHEDEEGDRGERRGWRRTRGARHPRYSTPPGVRCQVDVGAIGPPRGARSLVASRPAQTPDASSRPSSSTTPVSSIRSCGEERASARSQPTRAGAGSVRRSRRSSSTITQSRPFAFAA